ncbi:sortilin isoform X2 [Esox lucius]|uniref:sortilin isoform X2 n=1 Tax=Esox lucius TaxID=8010 RepID=UPI00147706BA|nr:sortilin isoform X2 [Esox lucius]
MRANMLITSQTCYSTPCLLSAAIITVPEAISRISHLRTVGFRTLLLLNLKMTWILTVLSGACFILLGSVGDCKEKLSSRTMSFHQTQLGEKQGQVLTRQRRDDTASPSPTFTACKLPLTPYELGVLDQNTHETGFHGDDGASFTLTWVGDGTGVILVLSTISAPLDSFFEGASSRLYRSADYGKSFYDISHLINNTFIRKDFGILPGPGNSHQVILTAETPVLNNSGGVIFISTDAGVSFKSVQLPFHPAQPITFHFLNPEYLVVISIDGGLWLSVNFGAVWIKAHEGTYSYTWGSGITLFFSSSPTGTVESDRRGELLLKRTEDLGKTFTTVAENVFSFGYIGGFLFASIIETLGAPRVLYVSSDQGDNLNKAKLPSASTEQFYSVLDGDEDMIFMHVDDAGEESYFGTVYISDDRGILYSKSLEHHLFGGEGKSDFTNVTSLRGVYLTNILEEDGRIRTVITFNRGGNWRALNKPQNVECGEDEGNCNLHIHGEHSRFNSITPMLPLSDPTAIGLVIAHGSVGDSISSTRPDVFVSEDGGYSWRGALRGAHHYSILDSGGLIVAVEAHPRDGQINTIKFSTDEGQCWKVYNFTKQPIFFAGLASEPGTKTMNISVWGYRPDENNQPMWVAVTIDFQSILTRECRTDDYVQWLAHAPEGGDSAMDGCVLGYKEVFFRLKKNSVCRNGRDYVVSRQISPCPCTREDYLCDYGYYHHENSSECLKQPEAVDQTLNVCQNGEEVELIPSGYRKVPGDYCVGGFTPLRREESAKRNCGSSSQPATPSEHSALPVSVTQRETMVLVVACIGVVTVILVAVASVVYTVTRMFYRNRVPAYRFSALQFQDDPERVTVTNRASVDSDDVSVITVKRW